MEKTGVIIVAGGSGKRCGGLPKQFRLLGGQPVLARTINLFAEALAGARIVVVLPAEYTGFWKNLAARFDVAPHTLTEGGAERFHSVRNGLAALAGDEELIVVQDGVRPLATPEMIRRVAAAAAEHGAAVPVTEPVDSFRMIGTPDGGDPTGPADATHAADAGGTASHVVDRRRLRIVQTPQAFRAGVLRAAYEKVCEAVDDAAGKTTCDTACNADSASTPACGPVFTDDASVVEWAGHPVFLAEGERTNLKITTAEDFTLAEAILAAREAGDEADTADENMDETTEETAGDTEIKTVLDETEETAGETAAETVDETTVNTAGETAEQTYADRL